VSLIGYIWDAPGKAGWLAVSVPIPGAPIWSSWALRQEPKKRRYDSELKLWYFHRSLKREIESRFIYASWAVRYESPFDRAQGKPHQQDPSFRSPGVSIPSVSDDFYSVLYVNQDAPKEVIKAAYTALMRKHHPDHGGDEETAKKLTEARDAIFQERGW